MQYEIEIKSLLGSKQAADALLERMKAQDPGLSHVSHVVQRNHYFTGSHVDTLTHELTGLSDADKQTIETIGSTSDSISVRTRRVNEVPNETILVIKGAKGAVSAAHAVERMEFEQTLPMPQQGLDQLLVDHGFAVQARWYAERDKYTCNDVTVEIMFSPGYGHVAEVELVTTADNREVAQARVREVMQQLELEELPNKRLERMFAHYNAHWQEYYDTDKVFVVA